MDVLCVTSKQVPDKAQGTDGAVLPVSTRDIDADPHYLLSFSTLLLQKSAME
jgi:hypothetical protein